MLDKLCILFLRHPVQWKFCNHVKCDISCDILLTDLKAVKYIVEIRITVTEPR